MISGDIIPVMGGCMWLSCQRPVSAWSGGRSCDSWAPSENTASGRAPWTWRHPSPFPAAPLQRREACRIKICSLLPNVFYVCASMQHENLGIGPWNEAKQILYVEFDSHLFWILSERRNSSVSTEGTMRLHSAHQSLYNIDNPIDHHELTFPVCSRRWRTSSLSWLHKQAKRMVGII